MKRIVLRTEEEVQALGRKIIIRDRKRKGKRVVMRAVSIVFERKKG